MFSRTSVLSVAALLALVFHPGCNNALNPLCGSSRPAPLIGSLAPSSMSFAQVQQGTLLIVNGSQFAPSSEVVINGKTLGATVIFSLTVMASLLSPTWRTTSMRRTALASRTIPVRR